MAQRNMCVAFQIKEKKMVIHKKGIEEHRNQVNLIYN